MKYVDSYRQCVFGVKNGNSWLLEIEGCLWLGGYKLVGNPNYVGEGCWRIDTIYGGSLTPTSWNGNE